MPMTLRKRLYTYDYINYDGNDSDDGGVILFSFSLSAVTNS